MVRWLCGFLVLGLSSQAYAQVPIGQYQRPVVNPHPTVSPYLNLGRGGTNAAIDYYGIVRPQQEAARGIQGLQQQFQTMQTQGQGQLPGQQGADPNMAATGRGVGGFLNYGNYFPLLNRQGGTTRAPVATGYAR